MKKKLLCKQRFGIRKTSLGVGSLLLGLTFVGSTASAEDFSNPLDVDVLNDVVVVDDALVPAETSVDFIDEIELLPASNDVDMTDARLAIDHSISESGFELRDFKILDSETTNG